ncbi:MAG: methyltransferase regulatory domain-containing protein, partial [Myxococcota bacterium]
PHARSLRGVFESMQRGSANVFLHDERGVDHDPCDFTQFAEGAGECGLHYLAEADLATMTTDLLPKAAVGLLRELAPDFIETQQLIDFLVNRSGRTSLLVRDDASVSRELSAARLAALHFTTTYKSATPAEASGESAAGFESAAGQVVHVGDEAAARLLSRLVQAAPESVPFAELAGGETPSSTADETSRSLLALLGRGLVEPRLPLGA